MKKATLIIAGFVLLGMLLVNGAGCGDSGAQTGAGDTSAAVTDGKTAAGGGKNITVRMIGNKFDPAEMTVARGTTVTWSNEDSVEHTVTAANGAFDSGKLKSGQNFGYTFNEVGTFEYRCTIHPSMTGKITVTE